MIAVVSLTVLASGGCSGDKSVSPSPTQELSPILPQLISASTRLRTKCRATARSVGYPVPCPTRVPAGLTPTRSIGGCHLDIVGPGGTAGCARSWRKWVVGSSETADQHLVITASPRALRNYAKVVSGPAWYPGAHIRPLGWMTINRWRTRAVYVPARTNEGSAFAGHVVLIWTVSGHTYGVGFHQVQGLRQTLKLDVALARGIRLVAPGMN